MSSSPRAAALVLATASLLAPLPAQTLHVPSAYPTIQAALDAAGSGTTVMVAPGVYHESLRVTRNVSIVGAGWTRTILDGQGDDGIRQTAGTDLTVRNLWIRGCDRDGAFAIELRSPALVQATIKGCRLAGNDNGVEVWSGVRCAVTLERNQIVDNTKLGIRVRRSDTDTTVLHCTIARNKEGILLTSSTLSMANSILANKDTGVRVTSRSTLTVLGTNAWGHALGNYVYVFGPTPFTPSGTQQMSQDPRFVDAAAGDFHLRASSPCIAASWPTLGRRRDLGALPYDPNRIRPLAAAYGSGCGGSTITVNELPLVGFPDWRLQVQQALAGTPGAVMLGTTTTVLGLTPGCSLLVVPLVFLPAVPDSTGRAELGLAIPNTPAVLGQPFYAQWTTPARTGFWMSNGLQVVVGSCP